MTTGARSNPANVVVGFSIMMLGILLILDKLGMVNAAWALQFWPAVLILFGGALILQSLRGGEGAQGGRFPVGAVIWLVLLGVFFTNIFERRSDAARSNDDGVRLFAVMSGDKRVSSAEEFHGGEMTSIMGGTILDLRQAVMAPGDSAVIDVFALMGGATIFVPKDWTVDIETTPVMGGVKDERRQFGDEESGGEVFVFGETRDDAFGETRDEKRERRRQERPESQGDIAPPPPPEPDAVERDDRVIPAGPPPRIVVRGFVMMGGLVIKS